ncbi:hypothetical protein ACWGNM_15705 [Streptomyces sp. NPDC055796]
MNTIQRRRIPTYIGASCLAATLSFSTGATIATAAHQAPAMAMQDDSGSDQSGTDTSGSDTGNQQDSSHLQDTTTNQQDSDTSHPRTDTTDQQDSDPSHPQTDTSQTDGTSKTDQKKESKKGKDRKGLIGQLDQATKNALIACVSSRATGKVLEKIDFDDVIKSIRSANTIWNAKDDAQKAWVQAGLVGVPFGGCVDSYFFNTGKVE